MGGMRNCSYILQHQSAANNFTTNKIEFGLEIKSIGLKTKSDERVSIFRYKIPDVENVREGKFSEYEKYTNI